MNHRKYHNCSFSLLIGGAGLLLRVAGLHAHDTDLHALMSQQAAVSSENLFAYIEENLPGANPLLTYNSKTRGPISWIEKGSIDEDNRTESLWPSVRHHFYVPVPRNRETKALTDGIAPSAPIDSFAWASDANASSRPNSESWKKARDYGFDGLTKSSKSDREANLAHMFKALGHVIHLNQDLSQPSHARNDNHLHIPETYYTPASDFPDASMIEKYGLNTYYKNAKKNGFGNDYGGAFPPSARTWSDWRTAGFVKLEDFGDRKLYNGQASALDANESTLTDPSKPWSTHFTSSTLGLAEYSNGNFLSDDAVYTEVNDVKPQHQFPFPSIETSTNYREVRRNPKSGARYELFRDQINRKRIFLKKTSQGVKNIQHHCALSYLDVSFGNLFDATWTYKYGVSIHDDNVLQDYHSTLIPKAIEYSAGILDYFFRGKLEVVSVIWNTSQYTVTVRNQSGQEFATGGKFFVLKDDAGGNRTPVTPAGGVSLTQNVADNGTWQFNFPGPQVATTTKFVVVYQGTIGLSGGIPQDTVDATIAVAAKNFTVEPSVQPCVPIGSLVWTLPFPDAGTTSFAYASPTITFSVAGTVSGGNMVRDSIAFDSPGGCNLNVNITVSGTSGTFQSVGLNVSLDGNTVRNIRVSGAPTWGPNNYNDNVAVTAGTHTIRVSADASESFEIHGTISFSTF